MSAIRSDANAELVCNLIAQGYSLRQIGRQIGCDASAISHWVVDDADFAQRYARAREAQAEHMASELLEISDDGSNDWMEREGATVADHEHIQRSKLRVDARKWLMARMAPKRYGDKLTQELTGPGGGPIEHTIEDRRKAALAAIDAAFGGPQANAQNANAQNEFVAGAITWEREP